MSHLPLSLMNRLNKACCFQTSDAVFPKDPFSNYFSFEDLPLSPTYEISSAECYSVLCPFLTKMSIIYRWNQYQMFCLQSSLDVAYHISMRIYKLFNLASLPKNDFTLVLYCSMSILNQ